MQDTLFPQVFPCKFISPRNQSAGYYFFRGGGGARNHPQPPQKWNGRPLKSTKRLLSRQILICQSLLKPFATIGDKPLQVRLEEFVSTYPYPESPYGDVITKFSGMDDQFFIVMGLRAHGGSAINGEFQLTGCTALQLWEFNTQHHTTSQRRFLQVTIFACFAIFPAIRKISFRK